MSVAFTFDEALHQYASEHCKYPHVTGVLEDIGLISPTMRDVLRRMKIVDELLSKCNGVSPEWREHFQSQRGYLDNIRLAIERKREIGHYVHKAIHYLCEGDLDVDTVDEQYAGYIVAAQAFHKDYEIVPVRVEHQVIANHNGMLYGMRLDLDCLMRGCPAILDYKCAATVEVKSVGPQTAAYDLGLNEPSVHRKRVAVQLKPDGKYKPFFLTDRNDYRVWEWALALTWHKRNCGLEEKDVNGSR